MENQQNSQTDINIHGLVKPLLNILNSLPPEDAQRFLQEVQSDLSVRLNQHLTPLGGVKVDKNRTANGLRKVIPRLEQDTLYSNRDIYLECFDRQVYIDKGRISPTLVRLASELDLARINSKEYGFKNPEINRVGIFTKYNHFWMRIGQKGNPPLSKKKVIGEIPRNANIELRVKEVYGSDGWKSFGREYFEQWYGHTQNVEDHGYTDIHCLGWYKPLRDVMFQGFIQNSGLTIGKYKGEPAIAYHPEILRRCRDER